MDRVPAILELASRVTGLASTIVAGEGALEQIAGLTGGDGFDVGTIH